MLDLFEKYEQFIKTFHISCYELEGEIYRFKANLTFIDNSQLFIKASIFHRLPRLSHKDPFDRIIIWQAIKRKMTLVSKDRDFKAYRKFGLRTFW